MKNLNLKEVLELFRKLKSLYDKDPEFGDYVWVENKIFNEFETDEDVDAWYDNLSDIWENNKPIPDEFAKYPVKAWYFDEDDIERLFIELDEYDLEVGEK